MLLALSVLLATAWPPLPIMSAPPGPPPGARDAAVVAGTSDLVFLPDIGGAADNATDWFTWLTTSRGVPVERVRLLRNTDVTREQLLDAARAAAADVGEGGTLWIVFIGHGAPSADGDGLLLGVDTQPNERSLASRGIARTELLQAAQGRQARTVAVLDACFSGVTPTGPLVPGAQFTVPVRRTEGTRGVVVFTASDETAGPLPGHDRPAFSYLLLGAIAGWGDADGSGDITIDEAHRFASRTIQVAVTTRRQVPSVSGEVDDVVLGRGTVPAPDLGRILAAPVAAPTVTPQTPPPSPAIRDAAAHRDAVAAFRERAIRQTPDKVWVRGPYATPLGDDDLVAAGEAGAPKAAKDLSDLAMRADSRELIWVLPPVGGMLLGATIGLVTGGVTAAASGTDNPDRNYLLGGFIGTFAGASIGALAVSLPLNSWATLDEDDKRRRDNARVELATAANDAERSRLGLTRADVSALDDTPVAGR